MNWEDLVYNGALKELHNWRPGLPVHGNIQVLDFFSGCGGMSLGFAAVAKHQPSFKLLGGVDINARSAATYTHNFGVQGRVADVVALAESASLTHQFLEECRCQFQKCQK